MTDTDHQRVEEVLIFVHNLEHAGDVVDKQLMSHVSKRLKRGLSISAGDQAEETQMLDRLVTNLHAAASVFMTDDLRAARLLATEKEAFRDIEEAATRAHFDRLAGGAGITAVSALHLDVLRDLKQVNAHLVAAAAYPVLKNQGDLLPSRLRLEE
jgi:phosphate:Na+ symporter